MTTYNTGNPIGSVDPRDLYDDTENLSVLVNSQEKTEHPDRLGVPRKTWHGMEQDFQQFLVNSGYTGTGAGGAYEDYDADGPLTITALNQIFTKDGEFYRLKPDQDLPYTTTTWADDESNLIPLNDAVLRQELGGGVRRVNNISNLQSVSGRFDGDCAVVVAGDSAGAFCWLSGDQSTDVSVDEISSGTGVGGMWVSPLSDVTGSSGAWRRILNNGVVYGGFYGVSGGNSLSPYNKKLRKLFNSASYSDVQEIVLPNVEIYFDNSEGPISVLGGCDYSGGKRTTIIPMDTSQRIIYAKDQSEFSINRVRSLVGEPAGGENSYIGGGYWLFENCSNFEISNFEISKSFGTGIKCRQCQDFSLKSFRTNYNQFSGWELQGCSRYVLSEWESSYNGRNSVDASYKPLPSGWTGTHGGRAGVVSADGDIRDQEHSIIKIGRGINNSEYGFRAFASNTKGVQNLNIEACFFSDNGHPAGTYGSVTLTQDKGVDYLVNSDATGESENAKASDVQVFRSLGYGVPVSVDGLNHENKGFLVRLTGDALHDLSAFSLFGAKNYRQLDCRSIGAGVHVAVGSGGTQNVDIVNDRAEDCVKYRSGSFGGTLNRISGVRAVHRSSTATSGENGIEVDEQLDISDAKFIGFHRAIIYSSGVCRMSHVVTQYSKDIGFRNYYNNSSTLAMVLCDFDKASPLDKAVLVHDGLGDRQVTISLNSGMPTSGYFRRGSIVLDVTVEPLDNTNRRRLLGWRRLTTGVGHTLNTDWEQIWTQNGP